MFRRDFLRLLTGAAMLPAIPGMAVPLPGDARLSSADEEFLDDMERRGCLYFAEQVGAKSGQVLDRAAANNTTGVRDPRLMASIAATGFGLTALCIADKRSYQPRAQIVAQVRRTLQFHLHGMPHDHGFFYHFNDVDLGGSFVGSEVSSIDTALLLCGILTARAHFHADREIVQLATAIYNRVDFPWMLNGGTSFAMGYRNGKFIPSRWNHYCELMMLYLLAMGSPTHPVPASAWDEFTRDKMTYAGIDYIGGEDPLFVHQYSHAWFDFRNKRDKYADYFQNSISATRAHELFCVNLGKPYSLDYWGISASDSAHGYTAWGGPSRPGGAARGYGGVDGSVVPNATAGSLPFLPQECLRVLRSIKERYGDRAWGRYGFCDALHPSADWYDPDVLGIDLGIGVLMAENLRSSFVWETFARNREVGIAMQRAGFRAS
jgi:hypothetical protein